MRNKNIFFTIPQIDESFSMHEFISAWNEKFGDITSYIVASEEQHEDEGRHIHALVVCVRPIGKVNMAVIDEICSKHAHMEPVRSVLKTLKYVCKEGNWTTSGVSKTEIREKIKEKLDMKKSVVEMVMKGSTFDEILLAYPNYMVTHLSEVKVFRSHVLEAKRRKEKMNLTQFCACMYGVGVQGIRTWLSEMYKMQMRDRQLWIYGEPLVGKSHMVAKLDKYLRIYHMPLTEDFYDFYSDEECDLIVLDEFKGQKQIQVLNQWLDGQAMCVRVKGGQVMKRTMKPMIILSNFSPDEVYNVERLQLDALKSRLNVTNVTSIDMQLVMACLRKVPDRVKKFAVDKKLLMDCMSKKPDDEKAFLYGKIVTGDWSCFDIPCDDDDLTLKERFCDLDYRNAFCLYFKEYFIEEINKLLK